MTLRPTRRAFLKRAASAGTFLAAVPALAQGAAGRIVVIGGGFAGASCARALKSLNPHIAVTLVEPKAVFTACPFSNEVVAGLRELREQQFGYDSFPAAGILLAKQAAVGIDPQARNVVLADGSRLTYDRLVHALKEPQNWLTYWGDYSALRHRDLDQINTGNVINLRLEWIFQTGQSGSFEAVPLVVDGVMYVTAGNGYAFAVDARSGRQLWSYKHSFPAGRKGNGVNRGFAILGDRLFMVTPDANLVAQLEQSIDRHRCNLLRGNSVQR